MVKKILLYKKYTLYQSDQRRALGKTILATINVMYTGRHAIGES